jgi:hypothetical protein
MTAAATSVVNIMLEAALRYARAGYPVVVLHGVDPKTKRCTCAAGAACKGPGKHPRAKNWTQTATTDEQKLRRLLTRHPSSNIGIMPPAGTVIVDVDPRNGGDASALNLPARTPTQHTGGGGTHHIVRVDGDAVLPKRPGIDYRKPGRGQVVVEPSIHVSGGRYTWERGLGYAIAPAKWQLPTTPAAADDHPTLAPELAPLVEVEEALDAPVGVVEEWLRHAPSDEYGDWINVGQALKHAYGDDGLELWDAWSARSDKYPGRAQLEAKWASFDKNRDRALRTLRSVRHLAQRNGWRYTPPELDFSSDLWRTGLVADLVATPAPPIEWVVGQVLPRRKVVMLGGPGGAGKSYLMLSLACQHASGVPLLGSDLFAPVLPDTQRKVIYFTAEDDRDDIHRRLHAVFDAYVMTDEMREEIGACFSVKCTRGQDWRLIEEVGGQLVASRAAELIIDRLRNELGLSLVMFDPSVMFAGVDENDNAAAAVYMRVLDRIAGSLGCGVLVGTHTNKGALAAESLDQSAVRGASAFVDNARGAWLLRGMTEDESALHSVPARDRHRYARLQVVKNNYGPSGAEVWLERVAGGALRAAVLPTLGGGRDGTAGTDMPPIGVAGTSPGQRKRSGARAAAMQAYAHGVLRYVADNADDLTGGVSMSLRTLGKELWASDATLTTHGMLDRARRVVDFAEAQGWLRVARPSGEERAAHQPSTYIVTPTGKEQLS